MRAIGAKGQSGLAIFSATELKMIGSCRAAFPAIGLGAAMALTSASCGAMEIAATVQHEFVARPAGLSDDFAPATEASVKFLTTKAIDGFTFAASRWQPNGKPAADTKGTWDLGVVRVPDEVSLRALEAGEPVGARVPARELGDDDGGDCGVVEKCAHLTTMRGCASRSQRAPGKSRGYGSNQAAGL